MTIDKENFTIPNYFSDNTTNQFKTGKNVSGLDLNPLSYNQNYLIGNGMVQMPYHTPDISLLTIPEFKKVRYRPKLWSNVHDRYWNFVLTSDNSNQGSSSIVIASTLNGNDATNNGLNQGRNYITFRESCDYTGSVWAHDDVTLTCYNFSNTTTTILFSCCHLYNAPTRYLNPTTQLNEVAVDNKTLEPHDYIYSTATKENSSIAGIARAIDYFKNNIIKGIFTYATYYADTVGTAYGNGIRTTLPSTTGSLASFPMVFATATDITQSSKNVYFDIFCGVEVAGNTGRFEISSAFGNGIISFTNTTPQWLSGTFRVPTDTPAYFNGIGANQINGTQGNFIVQLTKPVSTGANSVNVWSIHIYETLGEAS